MSSKKRSASKISYDEEEDEEENIDDELLGLVNKKRKVEQEEKSGDEEDVYYEDDFDDGFDEEFYGDEEDRKWLDSLSKLDREQIIFQRWEKRDANQKKKERLKREGKLRSGSRGDNKKKSSPKAKKIDSKAAKESAIADIGARRKANKEKKKPNKGDSKSDLAYDEEDDDRAKDSKANTMSPGDDDDEYHQTDVTLDQVASVLITRSQLAQWFKEPFFERTVKGCFVRVLLGENDRGERTYRLAEVHDIVNGREYSFEGRIITKYLMLKHGVSKKKFQLELVSNQNKITETEFKKWKEEMINCQEPFPAVDVIAEKKKQIDQTKTYSYTDKDISGMATKMNISKYKTEKTRLQVAIEEEEDPERKREYEMELEKLVETYTAQHQKKEAAPKVKSAVNIQAINERNKKKNQQVVMTSTASKKKAAKTNELDPFARRSTQSSFFSFSSDPSPTANKNSPSPHPVRKEELLAPLKSPGSSLVEAHKFDLDIDIDIDSKNGPNAKPPAIPKAKVLSSVSTQATKKPESSVQRKSLSLADYMKKKGQN